MTVGTGRKQSRPKIGALAQVVEGLPSMHRALGLSPSTTPGVGTLALMPALERQRQEDQGDSQIQCLASLGYVRVYFLK